MSVLSGKTILVIEDEFLVALSAENALVLRGAAVAGPVATEEQALEALAANAPHAALLDLNLNGVRSNRVAEALRAAGVPFVVATGYGVQAGFSEPVLSKPYTEEQLIAALESLFGV